MATVLKEKGKWPCLVFDLILFLDGSPREDLVFGLLLIGIFEERLISVVSKAWVTADGLDRGDIAKEERSHH